MTGQPLPPKWSNLAKLVHGGIIGVAHLDVAKAFFRHLPHKTDPTTVDYCEAQLADYARDFRPDEMNTLAQALLNAVNPDGTLDDERDRASRRSFLIGRQTPDKMVNVKGTLDPATAAALESFFVKFAAPGMCNPKDTDPTIEGEPTAGSRTTRQPRLRPTLPRRPSHDDPQHPDRRQHRPTPRPARHDRHHRRPQRPRPHHQHRCRYHRWWIDDPDQRCAENRAPRTPLRRGPAPRQAHQPLRRPHQEIGHSRTDG